uniref:Alpha-carbonic anhydrase domain-containing protein n=1 Tax=Leersia perrieri TaxID=77586 RepID=A0A0D9X8S4_9ORYZ
MHSTTRVILLAAAAVILLSASPAARAQETENERKFSYIPGSPNGPANWSSLNRPFWDACNNESNQAKQSPIDLADDRVKPMLNLGFLDYSYQPAQATIENRGHDIEVKFTENAGRLMINGKPYQLMQLHWHTPAEHTVNGRRYDMELHLVHSDGNNNAVIGNLYEIGNPDPFLLSLEPYIRILIANRTDNSKPMPIGKVDPSIAKSRDAVYYRYNGSLTTPACTEGVIWTVFKRTQTVAKYQLDLLRDAVDDGYENNARPLQKLNNRTISIFKPSIL